MSASALVSAEELRLLREQAECLIESYGVPGALEGEQPTEWHEGKVLHALADRLAAAQGDEASGAAVRTCPCCGTQRLGNAVVAVGTDASVGVDDVIGIMGVDEADLILLRAKEG